MGWVALAIGLTPWLRFDRAGALLVCGVIVAEVFHDKRHRLFLHRVQPGRDTAYRYVEVDKRDEKGKDIEITAFPLSTGPVRVNGDKWTLYKLANEKDFYDSSDGRLWDLEGTMKRAERTVDYIIVASAVVGTVLWAFA